MKQKIIEYETIEPTSTTSVFVCERCGTTTDWVDSGGCVKCKGSSFQTKYKEVII